MAKRGKNQEMLQGTVNKTGNMMEELGTELGLTEQPKESKKNKLK
ncbi:hypothetical protein [Desulforamulus reducens]|nr:hypothetical protein [Desulforamulus reducens]